MAKRTTPEAQVMTFFETADPIVVSTVYNIIKSTVARRLASATPAAKKAVATPRAVRTNSPSTPALVVVHNVEAPVAELAAA